jgi:hypothetical protein
MEQQRPLAQGTGSRNNVVNVFPGRVELRDGWQNRNIFSVAIKEVVAVSIKGLISSTLTIEVNDGRRLNVEGMARPDARQIKAAVEDQKQKAGLYE